jgi:hypothetical protein
MFVFTWACCSRTSCGTPSSCTAGERGAHHVPRLLHARDAVAPLRRACWAASSGASA